MVDPGIEQNREFKKIAKQKSVIYVELMETFCLIYRIMQHGTPFCYINQNSHLHEATSNDGLHFGLLQRVTVKYSDVSTKHTTSIFRATDLFQTTAEVMRRKISALHRATSSTLANHSYGKAQTTSNRLTRTTQYFLRTTSASN
jgi:hypothetical protein